MDVPIDRSKHAQSLVPPNPEHIIGFDILLLVMFTFLFTFVEGVLYADVCLYFSACGFETNKTSDSKRILDLYLNLILSEGPAQKTISTKRRVLK